MSNKMTLHKVKYFVEGWTWECACGANGQAVTKAECKEQYAAHRDGEESHDEVS